jgi:cytochrome c-type biogenesis protein CcmH/NrfG
MSSKREQLLEMLKSDPDDVFCLYGLAMWEKTQGNFADSLDLFNRVLTVDPDHVASYLMKAQLLIDEGDETHARETIYAGAAVAKKIGDQHALGELLGLLDMI